MDSRDVIQRRAILVAFCNPSPQDVHFIGEAVGYYDQPTYMIQVSGQERTWAASLVREATPDEQIAYWRDRARKAETVTTAAREG